MSRNATWRMFLCLAALLLLSSAARADYEAGQAAWEAGRYSEALTQWEAAAGAGDSRAMLALGRTFVKGLGVRQDYVLAHKWLNLAAGRGSAEAATEREALAAKMTPQQIASAQDQARVWRSSGKAEASEAQAAAVPKAKAKTSSPPTIPPTKRGIREAQELMAELGYKPGPADGVWGPRSEKAYTAFLRDTGQPAGKEKAPSAVAGAGTKASAAGSARTASRRPAPKCAAWNTPDFFETATPSGVGECLRRGADPKARDTYGRTPLHLAAGWSGNPAVIDVLVNAGADVEAQEKWWKATPL